MTHMPTTKIQKTQGFLMPSVVIIFGVCFMLLLTIFQYVTTVTNLTSQVIYRQVALTAARAALDYGKEQFDSNQSYSGTAETTMFTNGRYKTTYQLVVVSTTADQRTKQVQGIGRIYLPANAATARYSRTINGEIIRSQIVAQNPSDFSPLAWYDASCNDSTSAEPVCDDDTVLANGTGTAVGNPTSLREERADGVFCNGAPNTGDNNLAMPTGGECGGNPPSSNTPRQRVGMIFSLGSQLPKGMTLTNARLQFTTAVRDTANIVLRIRGIDVDNVSNFTSGGSNQINGVSTTSASVSWTPGGWNTVGQSGSAQQSPDIKSIIQEIIDRPGWVEGNRIGLYVEYISGPGARRPRMTPITLTVSYSGSVAANTNDSVQTWKDRSGNGFHLVSQSGSGNWPTKSTIAVTPTTATPQGKPMLNFKPSQSVMVASVPLSSAREANTYSAFAIMRVKSGTATDSNGTLVGFYGSGTGNVRYSPFMRHPSSGVGSNNLCISRATTARICQTYGSSIQSGPSWTLWSGRETLTERDMLLRRNGANSSTGASQFYDAIALNAPYSIVVGGNAQTQAANSDVEFAEIILYDRMLTCPDMESIELYLAEKWGFTDATLASSSRFQSEGCAENQIPAY